MENRIREAYSLRSVGIADGLSVPAGHLTHSALTRSGALTANLHFVPILALPLPLQGPVFGMLRIPCNASGIIKKRQLPPRSKILWWETDLRVPRRISGDIAAILKRNPMRKK